ncbi:TetR/AcrR family transcriptional regulator [Alteromonas sp. CYL-A6]|uniref:TetR/AcrR family transcriptional regulator n=1 Tax=Alteromonas nitratireducens TaxID=3390813 RepID=UPI0034C27266
MPKVTSQTLEARKDQILSAAAVCFSRSGFHRTTMRDILREAQLSAGAVYNYFPSKEAILQQMAERDLQAAILLIDQLSPSAPDAVIRLVDFMFGDLDRIITTGGATITVTVLAEVATNAELHQHIMPFRRQLKRQIIQFVQACCSAQKLSVTEGKISLMVDALFQLFNGAICSAALGENVDSNQIAQLSRQLVAITLGLKTKSI